MAMKDGRFNVWWSNVQCLFTVSKSRLTLVSRDWTWLVVAGWSSCLLVVNGCSFFPLVKTSSSRCWCLDGYAMNDKSPLRIDRIYRGNTIWAQHCQLLPLCPLSLFVLSHYVSTEPHHFNRFLYCRCQLFADLMFVLVFNGVVCTMLYKSPRYIIL